MTIGNACKRLSLMILIAMCAVGCSNETKAKEAAVVPTHQVYIEGFAEETGAEVRLNDIPLGNLVAGADLFSIHAEVYLVPGENTITVTPSSAVGSAAVRLVSYELGEFVDGQGGSNLMVVRAEQGKANTEIANLPTDRPKWTWMEADVLNSDSDHKEALAFARGFYKTLISGDTDKIIPALQPVHTDYSRLTPDVSVAMRNEESKEGMKNRVGKEIWQFDDLGSIDIELIPAANGRLYLVQRADGSPLFRTSQAQKTERYTFYSMIGRKDGKWAFYR